MFCDYSLAGEHPATHVVTIHANDTFSYAFTSDLEGGIDAHCYENFGRQEWMNNKATFANMVAVAGAKWAMVPVGYSHVGTHNCVAMETLSGSLLQSSQLIASVAIAALDALFELHFVYKKVHAELDASDSIQTRINNVNELVLSRYNRMHDSTSANDRAYDVKTVIFTLRDRTFSKHLTATTTTSACGSEVPMSVCAVIE